MCLSLQLLQSAVSTALPELFQDSSGPSRDVDVQSLAAILPAALPDELDYCNDVHMATIHFASALFLHLLDRLKQDSLSDSVSGTLHLLQPASVVMLSACPLACYDLLVTYLRSAVNVTNATVSMPTVTGCEFTESRQFYSLLPGVILEPMKAVACHPNTAQLQEMTSTLEPLHC